MKLVYIVNARIPTEKAHGVQIMKMCDGFSTVGMDVTLVLPRRFGAAKKDAKKYYGVKYDFKIVYLPIIDVYSLGYIGFIIGSLSFALSSFVYGIFQKKGTIFYSRDQDQFSFFPFFFGLQPYFFEVHGLKEKSILHRRLFKRIRGIIATNSFIKTKLLENFPKLRAEQIALLPNGVELEMFAQIEKKEAREKLSLPLERKLVIYTGHFYAWKGAGTLVEAAKLIDAEVYMVGGRAEDIDRLRTTHPEAARRVHFVGFRPFSEVPIWCAAADVLVLTGTAKDRDSVHYTSPIKLFEYMATGRPIVAVDSPAVRDVVGEDAVTFYTPDDPASLARSIGQTLSDEAVSFDKARTARRNIQKYSWKNRAENIKTFIARLI